MGSEERTLKNLADFKKRLYENWPVGKPKPTINPPNGRRLRHMSQHRDIQKAEISSSAWQDHAVDPHRWMECMKRFSEEFRHLTELRKKQRHGHSSSRGPVVVALIDDGKMIHAPSKIIAH